MASSDLSLSAPLAPEPATRGARPAYREPFPLGLATQALAIFAGVGASLGLFFQLLQLPPGVLSDFIGGNLLSAPPRTGLSLGFLLGGLLGGGLALAFLAIRRRAGVAGLRRAADVVFPLALTFLLPSLFTAKPWSTSPTIYLLQLVGTVLALEWTIRRSLLAWP